MTLGIFACDPRSVCSKKLENRGMSHTLMCRSSLTQTTPYFTCSATGDYVPFSLVCDWSQDCAGNSDETFCQYNPCVEHMFDCGQRQCIHSNKICDGVRDCTTFEDEKKCRKGAVLMRFTETMPPALVNFDRPGSFTMIRLPSNTTQCPETHFMCPVKGYCLPVYTRCNGVFDCPGHEDEAGCDAYTCPGFYRCLLLDKTICMHVNHLCDGVPNCPHFDDELMCKDMESCPDKCVCYGNHFYQNETSLHLRYLEARDSGLTLDEISGKTMLIYLGIGACGLTELTDMILPNLRILDLSDNQLHDVRFRYLLQLKNLKELVLAGNPLSSSISNSDRIYRLTSVVLLNLSRVLNQSLNLQMWSEIMPQIQILDLSHSGLNSLTGKQLFGSLKVLNLRGCPTSDFGPDFMKDMRDLQEVFCDNYRLCCSVMLPATFSGKCVAPLDEMSSCGHLLMTSLYKIIIAVFAGLALPGNLASAMYRMQTFIGKKSKTGYVVFVIHLSVSDFLMGVYLLVIAVADHIYAGRYLWMEKVWKHSAVCSSAGFLSFVSCEVSSFLVFLITVDRFLVICFPFSHVRFGITSAQVACAISWGLGVILASVPLLPVTSHWAFYSQTGICIPLPVTRADFPGRHYSFSVMIIVNLIMFLLIAFGQALIYWSFTSNTIVDDGLMSKATVGVKDRTGSKCNALTIARRLLVIAMSDFLCWFPIGVCGLLAKLDVAIPVEINVALGIIVLPLNSALNPFLYTYLILRQKRHRNKERNLQEFITAHVKQTLTTLHR